MAAAASAPNVAAEVEPVYRHYRKDFGPLQTRPLHLDLSFDLSEARVVVEARTTFLHVGAEALATLTLNSKDLDIQAVELLSGGAGITNLAEKPSSEDFVAHVASLAGATATPLKFEVDSKDHLLRVHLPAAVNKGTQFVLRTKSVATPTAHILEGLYFDWTPEGQPKTIITQCQQYGFQRIVPSLDFMTAKAYYTTRLVADARYSHLISNGDLAPGYFDPQSGKPTPKALQDGRVEVMYYNHKVNMASYLFFLGAGTYVSYADEVEYADGNTFLAELLVFPKLVEARHAHTALQALIDSIQWCHLSTGPEATEHAEERAEIYKLLAVRDGLKVAKKKGGADWTAAKEEELSSVRAKLKQLISVWKQTGYAYTGAIYREISMQNSDYGGMENVGNTTILASRMVPSDLMSDPAYLYMEGVKIHEYYHNINGSQVTGESPFEIWLNEAVTVHIQREREAVLFGGDFMRLKEVVYSFTPGQGPLALDDGPTAMPIEPRGFNRTQELISAMTYSKAPEFVRMIELLIGKPAFGRGLAQYYADFAYSNATTDDWIRSMERASGKSLMPMANKWLRRSGHPHVEYKGVYDANAKTYALHMKQTRLPTKGADRSAWILPVDWALVRGGAVQREGVFTLDKEEDVLTISDVAEQPDFVSFARGWSFFGTHANTSASSSELGLQALTDPDVINRYFAYRAVTDAQKARIIEALRDERAAAGDKAAPRGQAQRQAAGVSIAPEWVELHARILFDESVSAGARASILREGEDIHTRADLAHQYWEISDARLALLQAVYDAHGARIVELYKSLEGRNVPGPHLPQLAERALKHHAFLLIAAGNHKRTILASRAAGVVTSADVSGLARGLLDSSFMSDRLFALSQFLSGPATPAEKAEVRASVREKFAQHPDSIESYVAVLSGLDDESAPEVIGSLLEDKVCFDVNQAGHARTAVRMWAGNRKRSLLTASGRALTARLFLLVGRVNQYSAQSFLAALNDLAKFEGQDRRDVLALARDMLKGLDPVKEESLSNQLNAILAPYKDEQ